MRIYLIGGAVRDRLLGVKSNDFDYVMVLDSIDGLTVNDGFKIMEDYMKNEGFDIFLSTPEMYTIRARFPKGHKNEGLTADFVLARKEVGYIKGTRRPILELGTLYDDLIRRDFTVNAMAEDEEGNIIDPFDGNLDLVDGILRSPQDPNIMLLDDPLRMLRALRFSITKDLDIHYELRRAMSSQLVIKKLREVVSQERIQSELNKMFKFDSIKTMEVLINQENYSSGLLNIIFSNNYYLELTNKKK